MARQFVEDGDALFHERITMLIGSRPINPPFSRTETATPVQHHVPHWDRSISEDQVAIQLIKCCHGAGPAAPKTE